MSTHIRNGSDDLFTNLPAQYRKFVGRQPLQIGRSMDRLEYGHRCLPSFAPVGNVAYTTIATGRSGAKFGGVSHKNHMMSSTYEHVLGVRGRW